MTTGTLARVSDPATGNGAARAHVVADQGEVIAFLTDPATFGLDGPVTRIDTHGAVVVLAGRDAYKLKRAVLFPFMDFSTLEKRREACFREVAISGPGAPGVYLGAVPVTRLASGGLALGGDGEPVDWLVHMRRFDERMTLDKVAERGELTAGVLTALVAAIVDAHRRAPLRDGVAATEALAGYLRHNRVAFAECADLFPPDRAGALTDRMEAMLEAVRPLLHRRGAAGFARRCHGDLHLRNVVLIDGRPTLFDAIEFDDGIATCDVLYDLAFLLMDLIDRGRTADANLVMNRYLAATGSDHLDGLEALPLFLAIRATIRAKVTAAALPSLPPAAREAAAREARAYFEVAEAMLRPAPRVLVAVGGLSGAGKSTVSAALAPLVGRAPGAVHLRSDVIRKQLAGVGETEPLPAESYTQAASDAVYAALRDQAARALGAGMPVVVDAVHARRPERAAIAAVAQAAGAAFRGVWLDAPVETRVARVGGRVGDASDATADVARRQTAYETGPMDWLQVDARQPPPAIAEAIAAGLEG
ncbi:AAA family ATPase [Chthonobacter rhizosphaerae]|uniref:bifunctional aminoglycoside phosphotransferase/ATP-binding protein n=1 Tax=Chthonobacter rhizosphaerae TaxID=2735553 RepID=UPI0015EE40F1|nr:bifunctional aminoglycoside phosphotransferase/ATP-binding protein [Chthonobacter rhizosphaerae]